ncbi:MAG: histidine phosphatase family protein [Gemmatimonadota bacterium]
MPETPLLYLVRHGQTDSNVARVYSGWNDDSLNETGRSQVHALATRLAPEGVERIFASPVRRAVETAQSLARRLGATVRTVHDLHEIEIGPWKGLGEEEIARLRPDEYRRWRQHPERFHLEGRESLTALQERALGAVDRISRSLLVAEDRPAIVVTHVAVIRALWLAATGRGLAAYHEIGVPHCAPFPVRWLRPGKLEAVGPPPEPEDAPVPVSGPSAGGISGA